MIYNSSFWEWKNEHNISYWAFACFIWTLAIQTKFENVRNINVFELHKTKSQYCGRWRTQKRVWCDSFKNMFKLCIIQAFGAICKQNCLENWCRAQFAFDKIVVTATFWWECGATIQSEINTQYTRTCVQQALICMKSKNASLQFIINSIEYAALWPMAILWSISND